MRYVGIGLLTVLAEPVLIGNRLVNVGSKRGDSLQVWNAKDWDVK